MTAAVSLAVAAASEPSEPPHWEAIGTKAPLLATSACRYLEQLRLSARPATVVSTEVALRFFCSHLVERHLEVQGFADLKRGHVESYKAALSARRTRTGTPLSANTIRMRLGMLRPFLDRIMEWDWDDAPSRNPIHSSDVPAADEPLPRFSDESAAARFLRAAGEEPNQLRQLCVELLARTGMRMGELCGLEADAVTQLGDRLWLRIPVGKLHNDRFVPLHPRLVELLWPGSKGYDDQGTGLLLTRAGRPVDRHVVTRMVRRVAKRAASAIFILTSSVIH
jgi:site-specific recombinase XerC